jgi:hypothetical protein
VPTLTERVLELAARTCGTNTPELAEHGIGKSAASGTLANLVAAGRLYRVEGQVQHQGVLVHQFFASQPHAEAWARLAPMYRPNMRLRKSSRSATSGQGRRARELPPVVTTVQRATWDKAPMVGDPIAAPAPMSVVSVGVASGIDPRVQVDPATFKGGELSRLGIGRYSSDAASCAARAVR